MSASTVLDMIIKKMGFKNDAALCRALDMQPPVISKIRSGITPLGPVTLLRMSELSGMKTKDIKALL